MGVRGESEEVNVERFGRSGFIEIGGARIGGYQDVCGMVCTSAWDRQLVQWSQIARVSLLESPPDRVNEEYFVMDSVNRSWVGVRKL